MDLKRTQVKTTSGAEGKKPAKDDDDDEDDGDSDADSVDSDCVDDLSGDEVDVSNIIEGGRRALAPATDDARLRQGWTGVRKR